MQRQLDLLPWLAKKRRKATAMAIIGAVWCVFACWVPGSLSGSVLLAGVASELANVASWAYAACALWVVAWVCVYASLHAFPDWWAERWAREQNGY